MLKIINAVTGATIGVYQLSKEDPERTLGIINETCKSINGKCASAGLSSSNYIVVDTSSYDLTDVSYTNDKKK